MALSVMCPRRSSRLLQAVAVNAASGTVSAQTGYIQVLVGATTAYIALYKSVTV